MTEIEQVAPSFADLGLDKRVLKALADVGYETPSPIQAATIPPLLEGKHLVGLAQTGTGKTAAFALPILSRIDFKQRKPQALVLAPTRELALQVAEAFGRYAHHLPDLHVVPIYGGQSYVVQLSALKRGAHIVVGTPGRVIDHLERGTLDLSELKYLVLDEADEMLRMGFQEDVERILRDTPEEKQVALFSATMPAAIKKISKRYLTDAVEVTVKTKTVTAANTRQRWLSVAGALKLDALTRILEVEMFDAMIVFVRTKSVTEDLAERLRSRGFAAAAINGDLIQKQRERTIEQLKNGQLDILVATDVAARGLDVDRISHVVNYDIPTDTESYIHRIGRTGRAGRSGEALLFVTPREKYLLNAIEKATRQPLTEMQLPTITDVNAQRVAKFNQSITAALESPELATYRSVIAEYATENDVPLADVAAALAVMSRADESLLLPDVPPQYQQARKFDDRGDRPTRGGDRYERSERPSRSSRDDRPARSERPDRGDRPERAPGSAKERTGKPKRRDDLAQYQISVGRRQKVQPGQIVGAIANEGGLERSDFGHIDIQLDHSIVELPAKLPAKTLKALASTRISGQLIEIRKV